MRTVSNYFDVGKNYPAFMSHWIEMSLSPHLFCAVGVLTLDLPSLAISLLFPPYKIFSPIRASGLNKSNLSCRKRKYWKALMYFMVISCDRGRGREKQYVSILEEEEVMLLWHLYNLPQTVTESNESDGGTKRVGQGQRWHGSCRNWTPFKTPGVSWNYQRLSGTGACHLFIALAPSILMLGYYSV